MIQALLERAMAKKKMQAEEHLQQPLVSKLDEDDVAPIKKVGVLAASCTLWLCSQRRLCRKRRNLGIKLRNLPPVARAQKLVILKLQRRNWVSVK